MVRTRVGYAGGTTADPTYHRLGDHSEVVEVDYDPATISYETLLSVFWSSHDATRPAYSRQYRSAVLYRTDEERQAAETSKGRVEASVGRVSTSIERLERFYRAEDYHQKYRLRSSPDLMEALIAEYGSDRAMVDSTAAARLNGWLGGCLSREDAQKWMPRSLATDRRAT